MNSPKVIITKHINVVNQYPFEKEIGLSTYDLALISFSKTIKKNDLRFSKATTNTFLI